MPVVLFTPRKIAVYCAPFAGNVWTMADSKSFVRGIVLSMMARLSGFFSSAPAPPISVISRKVRDRETRLPAPVTGALPSRSGDLVEQPGPGMGPVIFRRAHRNAERFGG